MSLLLVGNVVHNVTTRHYWTLASPPVTTQISFVGRNILNASGQQIVPRGPELTFPESDIADLDAIAATGANAIRVLITLDALNGVTPTSIGEFLARVRFHNMIAWVSFYTWNGSTDPELYESTMFEIGAPLGGGYFHELTAPAGFGTCSLDTPGPCYLGIWDRQWVFDLMNEYRDIVIIDAMQEYITPSGIDENSPAGRLSWATDARTHVRFFRERGYTQPLAIMGAIEGRNLAATLEYADTILAEDTVLVGGQSQIIFGWQAYWSDINAPMWYPSTQGALILGAGNTLTAEQAIDTILPTLNYPIQCGFDNYATDTASDYDIQMQAAAVRRVPWLWWDWRQGQLDCPLDGATCRTYVLTSQEGFFGARNALAYVPPSTDGAPVGGKTQHVFFNLNSLKNHAAGQGNLNTRVGNWVKRMSLVAPNGGNTYTLGARFGFFSQWGIPPRASAGEEEVSTPYINQYAESWVGAQNITVVGFVPDNFNGYLFDPNTPSMDGMSYQTRLLEHIDAWESNAPNANRQYVIYAGWNQLNGYGGTNNDPTTVTSQGYANWVSFGLGAYQTWMELLVSRLQTARPGLDIRIQNISKVLLNTYSNTVVGTIPSNLLFEDLAPHGRSTWYFLAGVVEYMCLFNEKPPSNFTFDSAWNVHSSVTSNYQALVDYMWTQLQN